MKFARCVAPVLVAAWAAACSTAAPHPPANVGTVLLDPIRPPTDVARDADRRPIELLGFAGVRPGSKIAELAPGGGYFTRILTGAVGPTGHIYAIAGRPSPALQELAAKRSNLTVTIASPGTIE